MSSANTVHASGLTKSYGKDAGVFDIDLAVFIGASALSRGLRFFVVAALIYHFGAPVSRFIDRWFNLLSVLFVVLLALGFVLVKYAL